MFDPSKALKKMLGPRTNVPKFGSKSKKDWDGDGIPNRRDCQPRNPVRQDWTQNRDGTWKRISNRQHNIYKDNNYDINNIYLPIGTEQYRDRSDIKQFDLYVTNSDLNYYLGIDRKNYTIGAYQLMFNSALRAKGSNLTIIKMLGSKKKSEDNNGKTYNITAVVKDREKKYDREKELKNRMVNQL